MLTSLNLKVLPVKGGWIKCLDVLLSVRKTFQETFLKNAGDK